MCIAFIHKTDVKGGINQGTAILYPRRLLVPSTLRAPGNLVLWSTSTNVAQRWFGWACWHQSVHVSGRKLLIVGREVHWRMHLGCKLNVGKCCYSVSALLLHRLSCCNMFRRFPSRFFLALNSLPFFLSFFCIFVAFSWLRVLFFRWMSAGLIFSAYSCFVHVIMYQPMTTRPVFFII